MRKLSIILVTAMACLPLLLSAKVASAEEVSEISTEVSTEKSIEASTITESITEISTEGSTEIKSEVIDDIDVERTSKMIVIRLSQSEINAYVGDTGQLSVGDFEGIKLKGTFEEVKDETSFELNSDGTWKALGEGEVTLPIIFTISPETMAEIQAKYPNEEILVAETAPVLPITIKDNQPPMLEDLVFDIEVEQLNIQAAVGDTGKLTVKDFEGVELKGSFMEIKDNPFIELHSDGTWKALKSGDTFLIPIFYVSELSMDEIKAKFPGQNIITPESQRVLDVSIKDKVAPSTIKDKNQGKVATTQKKIKSSNSKELPKTGEETEGKLLTMLLGVLVIGATGFISYRIK